MMYNTLEGCTSFFLVIFAGYTAGRPRTRTAGKIFSLEKQDFYMCVHTFTYGRRKTFSTCDSCPGRLVLSPTFDRSAHRAPYHTQLTSATVGKVRIKPGTYSMVQGCPIAGRVGVRTNTTTSTTCCSVPMLL
jgi:hypothetical protein